MVPVGHYVLPVGKGVAVMHSPALLHPCIYATPTNEQPYRVLSKRIPIKAVGTGKWDNDTSAGHCFCVTYIYSQVMSGLNTLVSNIAEGKRIN